MKTVETALNPAKLAEVAEAARILRGGGVVAFPTETVYGLGADCRNPAAVRRIFEIKGRPAGHPLIVHLASAEQLTEYAGSVPQEARRLAELFWPGPLTMILQRGAAVDLSVTGGLETVGLRVPAHPLALELLRQAQTGIAAPSANRFGSVSPTTAEHVRHDLGAAVDYLLDGGACEIGIESTIIDLTQGGMRLLRPGAITPEQLEQAAGCALLSVPPVAAVRAPGQLRSHYAPRAEVRLVRRDEVAEQLNALRAQKKRVVLLGEAGREAASLYQAEYIPLPPEAEGQAHELYSALRKVDDLGYDVVLACLPREEGLGLALADRLRRAAGQGEVPDTT